MVSSGNLPAEMGQDLHAPGHIQQTFADHRVREITVFGRFVIGEQSMSRSVSRIDGSDSV